MSVTWQTKTRNSAKANIEHLYTTKLVSRSLVVKGTKSNHNKIYKKKSLHYFSFCFENNIIYFMSKVFFIVCPPGTFLNSDETCEDCPRGQWNDLFNQTSCKTCNGRRTNKELGADECGEYIFHFYLSYHSMVSPSEKYFCVDSRCMI